jgi:hypothetical protein
MKKLGGFEQKSLCKSSFFKGLFYLQFHPCTADENVPSIHRAQRFFKLNKFLAPS